MDPEKLKNKAEALDPCSTSSSQAKDDDFDVQVLEGSVLGLKLRIDKPFMAALAAVVKAAAEREQQRSSSMNQPKSKKLKASPFPISSISIGSWKRVSGNIQGELTAKISYAKRKLVWEILNGNLKNKMLISWSDITAIRAVIHPDQHSTLEIELSNPPLFFLERETQPRKHTRWEMSSDFTNGQALLFRRHTVTFPPGKLDKPYENLLKCDQNLVNLSTMPFPTHPLPHFDRVPPSPALVSDISKGRTIVSENQPQLHYPISPILSASPLSPPLTTTQELGTDNLLELDEMAAEEYGCDFDDLSTLYAESNPIPPSSNTSYGMSAADHERVVMMQTDPMSPPPPPPPHIEGAGCSHGAIPGLGDERRF